MTLTRRYYIGLSATYHDPAIAIVGPDGRAPSPKPANATYQRTGIPMQLNTSLNAMGKPIIHSVEDALGVFYTTGLDALVIEDYLLEK